MYIFLYVCYLCMYIHITASHECIYVYTYVHVCTYIYTHTHTYTHTHLCTHIYMHTYVPHLACRRRKQLRGPARQTCVIVCVYLYVCAHTRSHARTYTHTHTLSLTHTWQTPEEVASHTALAIVGRTWGPRVSRGAAPCRRGRRAACGNACQKRPTVLRLQQQNRPSIGAKESDWHSTKRPQTENDRV